MIIATVISSLCARTFCRRDGVAVRCRILRECCVWVLELVFWGSGSFLGSFGRCVTIWAVTSTPLQTDARTGDTLIGRFPRDFPTQDTFKGVEMVEQGIPVPGLRERALNKLPTQLNLILTPACYSREKTTPRNLGRTLPQMARVERISSALSGSGVRHTWQNKKPWKSTTSRPWTPPNSPARRRGRLSMSSNRHDG